MNSTKLKILCDAQRERLSKDGFDITSEDLSRPWGGFFVIDEDQALAFASRFFPTYTMKNEGIVKLSPKILFVEPGRRLSWQYHHRRAEIWKCIKGPVQVSTSFTDTEAKSRILKAGDLITLEQGERHRLIGLNDYGIVAEIWQHTEQKLSDEEDIVRLQDDFGR